MKPLTCTHCGGPTSPGSMVSTLVSCGCPGATGRDRQHIATEHRDTVYCSIACERSAEAQRSGRPVCPTCRQEFWHQGPRPAYCSKRCQQDRERTIDRAVQLLAEGKVPDGLPDVERALRDLGVLSAAWRGHTELGHRLPPAGPAPPPGALEGLVAFRGQLQDRYKILRGAAATAAERKQREREAKMDHDSLRKRAERQNRWRQKLLKAADDG